MIPGLSLDSVHINSDIVFGIFKILCYNFSPRFKDLDDQRFWRATLPGVETGTYGPLEALARNRVNLNKVIMHWPDMLRVAGSLVTDQVRAYDRLRMFGRERPLHPAGAGVRRVRPDRQDRAPAAGGRPGRRHLLPPDEPAADRAGVRPQAGPGRVPWQARHHPPGIPGRDGEPARLAGARVERGSG
jgi:hypothetical protein